MVSAPKDITLQRRRKTSKQASTNQERKSVHERILIPGPEGPKRTSCISELRLE